MSFLLEVVEAAVAFFVVVFLLTSLDAMLYFHNNNNNEMAEKYKEKLTSHSATLCILEKPISFEIIFVPWAWMTDAWHVALKKRDSVCISATRKRSGCVY